MGTKDLTQWLDYYYSNFVKVSRPENSRKKALAHSLLDSISTRARRENQLFSKNLVYVGSSYQGTEVEGYIDFDVLLPLNIEARCDRWEQGNERVTLTSVRKGFIYNTSGSIIDSGQIKAQLVRLIDEVVHDWNQNCNGAWARVHGEPTIPVKITIELDNATGPGSTIPIDLTPCIPIANVSGPGKVSIEKASVLRSSNSSWPSDGDLNQLAGMISFFPAGQQWRISLPEGHKILIKNMDSYFSGSTYAKQLFRTLKALCYREWVDAGLRISSYALANIMFRELDGCPEWEDWTHDKLELRFLELLGRLSSAAHTGYLANYFIPGENVFGAAVRHSGNEALRRFGERVNIFRSNPRDHLAEICLREESDLATEIKNEAGESYCSLM